MAGRILSQDEANDLCLDVAGQMAAEGFEGSPRQWWKEMRRRLKQRADDDGIDWAALIKAALLFFIQYILPLILSRRT